MDHGLEFAEQRCPGGFYFKDLTGILLTTVAWDTFAQARDPLFFRLRHPQLGEVLQNLVSHGTGTACPCEVLTDETTISGTIGDIQTKLRRSHAELIYLLILEGDGP